jgi:predicted  nucleic acid-binding Zn-ribbon protein
MLSPGVSPEEKQSIQEKFDAAKREVEALEPEVLEASAAIDKAGIDGQEAHSKVIDATKALNERAELEKKVETVKRHLKDAAKELSKGDENEKKGIVKSLKTHISQYIGFLESSSLHCDEWMKANLTLAGLKLNEEAIFEKKSKLE